MGGRYLAFLYCTRCCVFAPSAHPRIEEWVVFHTAQGCGGRRVYSDMSHMKMSNDMLEGYRMENGLSPLGLLAFQGQEEFEEKAS